MTILVTWTSEDQFGGKRQRVAVWKRRATNRDADKALTYVMALENGKVYAVHGRYQLADYCK